MGWFVMVICFLNLCVAVGKGSNPHEQRDVTRDLNGVILAEIRNLSDFESCKWNAQCASRCCVSLSATQRECRRLSLPGERCSTTNLKGGYFEGACPCAGIVECIVSGRSNVRECRRPEKELTIISTTIFGSLNEKIRSTRLTPLAQADDEPSRGGLENPIRYSSRDHGHLVFHNLPLPYGNMSS